MFQINHHFHLILLSVIVLLASIVNSSKAQCPEEIIINNQADIELFILDYPNCEYLEGDLTIRGNTTDLSLFSNLKSVQNLTIENTIITDLKGLENIEEVGNLSIRQNELLQNLNFIFRINKVNDLTITENSTLTSLSGLSVDSILGNFRFLGNLNISDFSGMQSLTYIGGELNIESSQLSSLSGLQQLNNIEGGIHVVNNPELLNLEGLSTIDTIKNVLEISNNFILNSLEGLAFATFSGHTIDIRNNESLNSCAIDLICSSIENEDVTIIINGNGEDCSTIPIAMACNLPLPECPFGVRIENEDDYTVFRDSFANCTHLKGNFSLQSYDGELPVNAFDNLVSVGGQFNLSQLNIELPQFENLISVNSLLISGNNIISDLDILNSLQLCSAGNFSIDNNVFNGELGGFSNLKKINGTLTLINNEGLEAITGFNQLDSVMTNIVLNANNNLTTWAGFETLEFVGRDVLLLQNNSLRHLDALDKPIIIDRFITIGSNPLLSICHVEAVCNAIENFQQVTIFGNGDGCSDIDQVTDGCLTSISNVFQNINIDILPNPFQYSLHIENNDTQGEFLLLDIHGRVVWSRTIPAYSHETYTLSSLPSGQYIYQFTTASGHKSGVLIKE